VAAANAIRDGADLPGALDVARRLREHMKLYFAVDTLEYLRRGGRIGTAQAWVGGALKVKPILTIDNELVPIERVRTSGRAFERMIDYLQSRKADGADVWMVQHIRAPEQAERVVERGREIFGSEPFFVSEIGPVIGAHVGPGLLGVGAIPSALLAER
jgi:DegV family protein with EDD domain